MPPPPPATAGRAPQSRLGRWLLGAIVAGYVVLAVNASLLMPLWEIPDEYPHLQGAVYWANEGSMPDRTNLPGRMLYPGLQEPLAYWVYAAGLLLLDLDDVEFLPRQRAYLAGDIAQWYLHGTDEVFPFEGPVRRLHLLRLLSVLFGVATVLGTARLGRQLAPKRPAVALLAAGLVATLPAFTVATAGITVDSLSIALATWSLVALCSLSIDPAPTRRRVICLGLLIGASLLAKLTTIFLVALVPVALLLRRPRRERWSASFWHLDWIIAGLLLVTGPYFAWNLVTYGEIFAMDWYREYLGKSDDDYSISLWTAVHRFFLPTLSSTFVARYSMLLDAGRQVLQAWALVMVGGVFGWIVLSVRRRLRLRTVLWLPIGAVTINLIMCLRVFADFHEIHGRYMYPSLAALACLLALGWLAWLARPLALLGIVALFAMAVQSQWHEMGPAFWPPWRAGDPYFMAWNPLTDIPETRRLATVQLTSPDHLSDHVDPPTLRWQPASDPAARYTVHFATRGSPMRLRSYENFGLSLRDSYRIPDAIWRRLPPGVGLSCQVLRLPSREDVLAQTGAGLFIDVSPKVIVRKVQ